MPLDYDKLMRSPAIETLQHLTRRDTIIYALGVGAGAALSEEPQALKFVYEEDLVALPTMAAVLGYPGFWQRDPQYGLTWRKIVHAEQSIELHGPLPAEGAVRGVQTIEAIYDKGPEVGALLVATRRVFDANSGGCVATVRQTSFLRADGGFGGSPLSPRPHATPDDRPPDIIRDRPIRPEQAALYRLSGDLNPLHIQPSAATAAGFERPILHGLATYGAVGYVILAELCGSDPGRLKRFDARFSSPVYPGETIRTKIWREGPGRAAMRAWALERDVAVLSNGYVEYDA
jgi:acyl dehydratase